MQIFWSHFSENTAHEKGESILIMVAVEAEQEVIVGGGRGACGRYQLSIQFNRRHCWNIKYKLDQVNSAKLKYSDYE